MADATIITKGRRGHWARTIRQCLFHITAAHRLLFQQLWSQQRRRPLAGLLVTVARQSLTLPFTSCADH